MAQIYIGPKPDASGVPWESLIGLLPHLFWIGLLLFILSKIGRDGLIEILGRMKKISVAGVEIEFKETLQKAAEARSQQLSAIDLGRASRRLVHERRLVNGARLLWVDDHPDNNRIEMSLLEEAGARVDLQTTSSAALAALGHTKYDLILSDINREGDAAEGIKFSESIAKLQKNPLLIFYTGEIKKPVPAFAFGITNRPDELVHLVLDALARRRG